MKRIYIAGPISKGDMLHNIQQASQAFFTLMKAGFAPYCPHWSVFGGDLRGRQGLFGQWEVHARAEKLPRDTTHVQWIALCLEWVKVSDAVLRLPGESVGADCEVACAEGLKIPVFTAIEDILRWAKTQEKFS